MDPVSGMTVNERLAHFGLFSQFDAAVAAEDLEALVAVLVRARLDPKQASQSAAAILGLNGQSSGQHRGA